MQERVEELERILSYETNLEEQGLKIAANKLEQLSAVNRRVEETKLTIEAKQVARLEAQEASRRHIERARVCQIENSELQGLLHQEVVSSQP